MRKSLITVSKPLNCFRKPTLKAQKGKKAKPLEELKFGG